MNETQSPSTDSSNAPRWRLIALIAVGLFVWGVYHAVGAYRLNHNILRPVVVMACTLGFLAFWGIMLLSRARRLRREAKQREGNSF